MLLEQISPLLKLGEKMTDVVVEQPLTLMLLREIQLLLRQRENP
jgi:hypothetical protein